MVQAHRAGSAYTARIHLGSAPQRKAKVMALNDKQQNQFDTVCERIAKGKSLVTICKAKGMPG